MKAGLFLFCFCCHFVGVWGQSPVETITVKKISESIQLDGILNESCWINAKPHSNFNQFFPIDTSLANYDTEVYLAYDDDHLYIAAKCFTKGADFKANSLRRDFGYYSADHISFVLDTYGDKINAFLFGMNAFGARREALIANGGRDSRDFDNSWDNKWDGESKQYDNYWICEMAIPFNSVRYKKGTSQWRFNAYRVEFQEFEISTLAHIPANMLVSDLTNMVDMKFEEALTGAGKNISIIPYISASTGRDFEDLQEIKYQNKLGIGGDAKIAVTSGLNLDLTVNPDFSQVEVDEQVTNLQRFELFFPEKRQFFLENADLFGRFGFRNSNPFFSRRIGIAEDTITETNFANTIYYGARLSGRLNDKTRLGFLNMQTARESDQDLPGFNYSVLASEYKVFDRSNIGFIFVNKQAIKPEDFNGSHDKFNRVAGLEYRLRTADNVWTGKVAYHHSFTAEKLGNQFMHAVILLHNKRNFEFEYFHSLIGAGYDAQVGFVPRNDNFFTSPEVAFKFYPENEKISSTEIGLDVGLTFKLGQDDDLIVPDFKLIEKRFQTNFDINFSNSSRLDAAAEFEEILLLEEFDPTQIQEDDVFLEAGSLQRLALLRVNYRSDENKRFFYQLRPLMGSFYSGLRLAISGRLGYRFQPFGSISIDANYNYIDLGAPFEIARLLLLGPKLDITFTKNIFLATFVQYNGQDENLGINARFQWRFKPASDFFIVYTDNYLSQEFNPLEVRNRSLVAKLTYWFNL